jgi:hypothetical protein
MVVVVTVVVIGVMVVSIILVGVILIGVLGLSPLATPGWGNWSGCWSWRVSRQIG